MYTGFRGRTLKKMRAKNKRFHQITQISGNYVLKKMPWQNVLWSSWGWWHIFTPKLFSLGQDLMSLFDLSLQLQ